MKISRFLPAYFDLIRIIGGDGLYACELTGNDAESS